MPLTSLRIAFTHREPLTRCSNTLKSFFLLSVYPFALAASSSLELKILYTRSCIASVSVQSAAFQMNCPPRSRVGREGRGSGRTKPHVSRRVPRANEPRGFNYPSIFYFDSKSQNVEIFFFILLYY